MGAAELINKKFLEFFIGLNFDDKDIITELEINDKNKHLYGNKRSICSYLIQELEFMKKEVENKIKTDGIAGYEFYYSKYNTKLNHNDGLTRNPGDYDALKRINPLDLKGVHPTAYFRGSPIYPEDFDSHANPIGLPKKYHRSIYDNMCDIIRIYAEYPKDEKKESFLQSKKYIDALYTSVMANDTANIHDKFTEKTLEFCTKYTTELDLFDLCEEMFGYLSRPDQIGLYTNISNDFKKMKTNFIELYNPKSVPKNLYEVIHRSF